MIRNLPARYPEIGRIRLGEKVPARDGKTKPVKAETLIFTSNDEVTLKALASQHGGDVTEWEDGQEQYRLVSETAMVPVFLPADPIDTAYERWGSGGIARRCDGEMVLMPVKDGNGGYMAESPCACLAEGLTPGDSQDKKKGACNVTVRLRLVLPDVPGLGVWICTSHSIYAALELPAQIALLQQAMRAGAGLIPADFGLDHRTEKKPWEKFERDFFVPVLRVRASITELQSGLGIVAVGQGAQSAVAAPARAALSAAPAAEEPFGDGSAEIPPVCPDDRRIAIKARADALSTEFNAVLREAWKDKGIASTHNIVGFTVRQADAAEALLSLVEAQQAEEHDKRRKRANARMAEVGVKSDDARHSLVREATNGATDSTKALTEAQLAAVVDACDALKAQDEGEAPPDPPASLLDDDPERPFE